MPSPLHPAENSGFVLIAVLWFVTALATLTSIYTLYIRSTAPEVVVETDRLRARAVEVAGVELAAARLQGADASSRPSAGHFSFHAGDAEAEVNFRAEAGLVDLNFATKETLASLFVEFGAKDDNARSLAERVVAWRTALSEGAQQDEAALYRAAKRRDVPRRGPFQHVDELSLVLGAPPDLVDRVAPFLTVFSGRADVDVKAAPPEVLAILPKSSAPPTPSPDATAAGPSVNRVTVDVRLGPQLRFRAEAVILQFSDDSEPYRLLSWRD